VSLWPVWTVEGAYGGGAEPIDRPLSRQPAPLADDISIPVGEISHLKMQLEWTMRRILEKSASVAVLEKLRSDI
jgi:hypothetical protein